VNDRKFERRHNLRWAREGFALPSLSIVSSGIKFLSRGCVRLPGFEVAEVLREFVDAVVARLLVTATLTDDTSTTDALVRFRGALSAVCGAGTAWEGGYGYAATARSALVGENWKSTSVEQLADRLQIDQLEHLLLPDADACGIFDAIPGFNSCGNPCFSTVSKLRTDRQQMSRAFAAEFLAPHEMLRRDLSGSWVTAEEIDDVASESGVSSFVIRQQIENHNFANVA